MTTEREFKIVRAFVYAIRASGGKPSADKVIAMMRAADVKALHKTKVCANMRELYAQESGLVEKPELNLNYSEPESVLKRTEPELKLNTRAVPYRNKNKNLSQESLFATGEKSEKPRKPSKPSKPRTEVELAGYVILDAVAKHIGKYLGGCMSEKTWRSKNSLAARELARLGMSPEFVVSAWMRLTDYEGHQYVSLASLQHAMARDAMPKVALPRGKFTPPDPMARLKAQALAELE